MAGTTFPEDNVLKLERIKINDRVDTNCRDCSDSPSMKLTKGGVPRAYLCERHGLETAEREGLPVPDAPPWS
jgi:hypothetical protein